MLSIIVNISSKYKSQYMHENIAGIQYLQSAGNAKDSLTVLQPDSRVVICLVIAFLRDGWFHNKKCVPKALV